MDMDEVREKMLAGEDTPYSEREPHRGEAPHIEGEDYIDPVSQGPGGASGGVSYGTSGSHQGSVSANSHGGSSSGGSHRNHGDDAVGAFGQETGDDSFIDTGDGPRDKAIRKLQGL